MALTAYQTQFKRRMKLAIRLRAASDKKVRAHARLLHNALSEAARASGLLNALNQAYNVDVSLETLLVHTLLAQVDVPNLNAVLNESQPGEEAVLFNQVPDGNGGQELPANPLFGEVVTGMPIIPPAPAAVDVAPQKAPEQVPG